jgi:hypothetical protein
MPIKSAANPTLALRYTSIVLYILYRLIIGYLYTARFRTVRLYTY